MPQERDWAEATKDAAAEAGTLRKDGQPAGPKRTAESELNDGSAVRQSGQAGIAAPQAGAADLAVSQADADVAMRSGAAAAAASAPAPTTAARGIKPYYLLAIETSCDDTSASVVENGRIILSNIVSSQTDTHQRFGGIVPEVASRKHVENVTRILEEAVRQAGIGLHELSAIAVTEGPGLVGSLLVGMVAAKGLACALELPLIGVHHIAGHIYANALVGELHYPLVALVVSGGHTELVYMEEEGQFRIIGRTRDDAVGEAYDKVARALGLPYPGGPHIDRLALEADDAIQLPRAWLEPESYDFSFSGLKSAVLAVLNQARMKGQTINPAHVARGFQDSVIDVLVEKAMRAVAEFGAKQLLLCGGVAANRGLRAALAERCERAGVPLSVPPFKLCTDNAAMIAAAAHLRWERGLFSSLDIKAEALLSLEGWSLPKAVRT